MSYFLVNLNSVIFVILAFIHFYWAFGGIYALQKALPTDEKGIKLLNPSKLLTFLVGVVLFYFAYITFVLELNALVFLSIVFFIRAIGDFKSVGFFKTITTTIFAQYDIKLFSPLSLYLSISSGIIALNIMYH